MRRIAVLLVAALALSSCSLPDLDFRRAPDRASPTQPPRPIAHAYGPPLPAGATVEEPGEEEPREINTWDITGSLQPVRGEVKLEETMPRIMERGRIIVGVDQSQNLLSYRDGVTGELQGFEVDLAREIARDIFGDPSLVDFRFVESSSRIEALDDHEVDMIIRTMTVTRSRQQEVAFSSPYLTTDSRLLVMHNSDIEGVAQLPGRTVCVTDGSTALEKVRFNAPQSRILKTRSWADCLVALQQYQADAILSDDTILSGIAAQDPYTSIVGSSLASESYGVAMPIPDENYDSSGLIRQVNSTIERIREDGTWWRLYDRWFAMSLATSGPPPLSYRPETAAQEATP
ncbi:glutamate ABC transporter substrate-binding protein [Corynebacterium comes]|uniref:ABC transporter glutamine-binding protein GlnH n=1 Tax=Corynebacterium comes TaxID=2675218 RepID=A0A6B8W3V5_9CORY|nr:glutamate ABC transporter substrate-binding protein [Corynebacterium comes]QGU05606.1 ABC transporter glutamine-binding protein GlnH precursor [Corynebacterium comes]